MLIVTRFQPRIYSTKTRIKIEYFVIDELSKELEQTDPYYGNCLRRKGVIRVISCKPLGELKIILLLCSEVPLRVIFDIFLCYFNMSIFRRSCSSPQSKFSEKLKETFRTMEDELFLKFWEID